MTTNNVHHVSEVRNWKDILSESKLVPEGQKSPENGTIYRDEALLEQRVSGPGDEHGGGLHFLDGMETDTLDPFSILDLGYCSALCQSSSGRTDDSPTLQPISILERLICTNPIWFLSDIQRSGAVHLLQGRDVGNFIIRNSSKLGTMALSVRLPESVGPYIEHYLIEKTASGQVCLEGSETHFGSIPVLVTYYCQCCDELPVQLTLPQPIAEATTRQELLSLALLGQDFWVTPISRSSYIEKEEPTKDPIKENTEILLEPVQQLIASRTEKLASPQSETESDFEMPQLEVSKKYVVDSPGLFYHSSLADKISDYEDIWGCSMVEQDTKTFSTFKPQQRHLLQRKVKKQSVHTQVSVDRTMVTHWTQTEEKPPFSRQCSASVQDVRSRLSSPFYSEPIDSVFKHVSHRHSDPNILAGSKKLVERLRAKSLFDKSVSSSLNNMSANNDGTGVPVSSSPRQTVKGSPDIWAVDSSWEWLGRDDDGTGGENSTEGKFPVEIAPEDGDVTTVEDLILFDTPELGVQHRVSVSEYDNLGVKKKEENEKKCGESIDDTATEFSEPWDSLRWERVLQMLVQNSGESSAKQDETDYEGSQSCGPQNDLLSIDTTDDSLSITSDDTLVSEASTNHLDYSILGSPKMLTMRSPENAGESIQKYIYRLAEERDNTFGKAIENFIQCTRESTEINPAVIVRNIRQFMNGMKNYLLKHGEGQFEHLVQQERNRLKANEFLNIDATIEEAMHRLVIKPLKKFLYQLFINAFKRNGSLQLISDNIKKIRNKSPQEMGVKSEFQPPEGPALDMVKYFFTQLQQAYSPLKKLENLLAAISTIYNCVQDQKVSQDKVHASLGADDFLPIFIYVLVQCGLIAAEIEAEYMWGLLHPSLLSGEGGYYLTTLSSAIHVLKNWQEINTLTKKDKQVVSGEPRLPKIADLQGFMKIMIPDETSGSIIAKTLPVRPNMTTKEVCKMIAHKFKITNSQDYGLFKLVKGEETQLGDNESPQQIKGDLLSSETECFFAYKRCDTKFIWPVSCT